MRSKIIVGNWKMNKIPSEAVAFAKEFVNFAKEAKEHNTLVGFGATFICLPSLVEFGNDMIIAAENCYHKDSGAFTGEVSVKMLDDIGIKSCIIGHSERRQYFNETSIACNLKLVELLKRGMLPIYCVGETGEQYDNGTGKEVVKQQVIEGLQGIEDVSKVVIAYEPVWSIGTGKSASVEIAEDMCKFIRDVIAESHSREEADKVMIQYGGSVKANNVHDYMACEDVDGVLVGGASLEVESFQQLIKNAF